MCQNLKLLTPRVRKMTGCFFAAKQCWNSDGGAVFHAQPRGPRVRGCRSNPLRVPSIWIKLYQGSRLAHSLAPSTGLHPLGLEHFLSFFCSVESTVSVLFNMLYVVHLQASRYFCVLWRCACLFLVLFLLFPVSTTLKALATSAFPC